MIRITDTPKSRDRFGSIPIRDGKPTNSLSPGPYLPRRPKPSFLWIGCKRIVGLLLWLTLILGLGSPLLVPYLATTLLPKHLASTLNRPVTIARAEFNPLTCTLTLRHLMIGPKLSRPDDPVDPLLSADRISLALAAPKRLLHGEIVCNLGAGHFFLHLVRQKDGAYNLGQVLDDLLPGLPLLPLRFSWNTIALDNSRLAFDDEQTGKAHLAEELTLGISPGQANSLRLQAKINGVAITLPDTANPGRDDGPAVKTSEAIALVQELSQTANQYLQNHDNSSPQSLSPSPAP